MRKNGGTKITSVCLKQLTFFIMGSSSPKLRCSIIAQGQIFGFKTMYPEETARGEKTELNRLVGISA